MRTSLADAEQGHPKVLQPAGATAPCALARSAGDQRAPLAWGIDPGSPWQNAWIESFNGRLHDELLDGPVCV
jgi:hypothetical protein